MQGSFSQTALIIAHSASVRSVLDFGIVCLSLARNIVTNGYQAVSGTETLDQTEYLKLVLRYLSQARELDKFSASAFDDQTVFALRVR